MTVGSLNAYVRNSVYIIGETLINSRNEAKLVNSFPHSISFDLTVDSISFNSFLIFGGSSRYSSQFCPLLIIVLSLGNLGK